MGTIKNRYLKIDYSLDRCEKRITLEGNIWILNGDLENFVQEFEKVIQKYER